MDECDELVECAVEPHVQYELIGCGQTGEGGKVLSSAGQQNVYRGKGRRETEGSRVSRAGQCSWRSSCG